jgi:tRNA A-37 threonylcarbamoyl transferase component Bud32
MKEKYIDEGSYGCVLYPGKRCKDNKKIRKSIVKIFKDKKDYEDEFLSHKKIEDIFENNKKCIVEIIDNCEKKINTYEKQNYSKCKSTYKYDEQIIYQIIYQYGGKDLNFIASIKNTKFTKVFFSLSNIFEAIILLNKKNYVHFDIRTPNILYEKNSTKLIDFGLLLKYNEIKLQHFDSNEARFEYPPELEKNNYKDLYETFIHDINKTLINNTNNNNKLLLELLNFFEKLKSNFKKSNYVEKEVINNKIDIYMLGTVILNFILDILMYNNHIDLNIIEFKHILKLTYNMTHYDNVIRLTPENAFIMYKDLVYKIKNKLSLNTKSRKSNYKSSISKSNKI